MSPQLTLNYAACSDRGLVRGNNEDSAYAGPRLLALAYQRTDRLEEEANRRIEFRLLSPYPVIESAKAAEVVTGVTEAMPDAEAKAPASSPAAIS